MSSLPTTLPAALGADLGAGSGLSLAGTLTAAPGMVGQLTVPVHVTIAGAMASAPAMSGWLLIRVPAVRTVTVTWATDPQRVTCGVERPDGIATIYVYGRDAQLTRTGVGQYACALPDGIPGTVDYQWWGTNVAPVAGTFTNTPPAME